MSHPAARPGAPAGPRPGAGAPAAAGGDTAAVTAAGDTAAAAAAGTADPWATVSLGDRDPDDGPWDVDGSGTEHGTHGIDVRGRSPEDWAWVEEWRAGREPVPWAHGLTLAFFAALLVACALVVLSTGLAGTPWVDLAVNLVVAAGLAPAVWLSRGLPVLRWVAAGVVLGIVLGWVAALFSQL
ncbi:DUF2537 domain-containing protein [Nakamurella endophytica]|uniref:DUF2537 domain-containing protein n=1 Tax=Nakamurella endophytica TaxID=1748367 RepID=A0A917WAH2_9ACTN|nr:DUF2537 domain-containing protein [Nakamurella endophytica]GGL88681.1 hypothetical protein GCM10011594_05390 [Nakamurella endophytica]